MRKQNWISIVLTRLIALSTFCLCQNAPNQHVPPDPEEPTDQGLRNEPPAQYDVRRQFPGLDFDYLGTENASTQPTPTRSSPSRTSKVLSKRVAQDYENVSR